MKILLLGPGKMGGAWLNRLASTDVYSLIERLAVVQPSMNKQDLYKNYSKIEFFTDAASLAKNYEPDVVIIAIKPQIFSKVLPEIQKALSGALILSVAAGKSVTTIKRFTNNNNRIVRVMPNIGMSIGKSVNLLYADQTLTSNDKELAETLLSPTGNQYWLDSEVDIDKLTPITGCSPAFYYQLSLELVNTMITAGYNKDMATQLVKDTLAASAAYGNKEFKGLISDVASKKGVTEAALEAMEPIMNRMVSEAYEAAICRIKELKNEQ